MPAGGWRGSPNSIAALMRCQVPRDQLRKCDRCGMLALSGRTRCRRHSAKGRTTISPAAGRGESRLLARLDRLGLLPLELLGLPVWRDLSGLSTGTRAPARVALVLAWDQRDQQPLHWAKVQRRALDLGKTPAAGRSNKNTAGWYENY